MVTHHLQYEEYEEVVVDYRAKKEKLRLKEEEEARQNSAATKVCPKLDELYKNYILVTTDSGMVARCESS